VVSLVESRGSFCHTTVSCRLCARLMTCGFHQREELCHAGDHGGVQDNLKAVIRWTK
jgi:hypothetical protein